MSAPALALIVPTPGNRSQPGSGKPGTITAGSWGKRALPAQNPMRGARAPRFATDRPETGLPPEVTGYHPQAMQALAAGANREPVRTLFGVRTVAKHCARTSRIDHGEKGPVLPRATCGYTTGKTVMGANAATARAWSHFNAPRRPIGEPRRGAGKRALWCHRGKKTANEGNPATARVWGGLAAGNRKSG